MKILVIDKVKFSEDDFVPRKDMIIYLERFFVEYTDDLHCGGRNLKMEYIEEIAEKLKKEFIETVYKDKYIKI